MLHMRESSENMIPLRENGLLACIHVLDISTRAVYANVSVGLMYSAALFGPAIFNLGPSSVLEQLRKVC